MNPAKMRCMLAETCSHSTPLRTSTSPLLNTTVGGGNSTEPLQPLAAASSQIAISTAHGANALSIASVQGAALDGGRTYRLTVPPNVPVEQYWSVTAYDRETHALIKNMDRASRASNAAELQKNAPDGLMDKSVGMALRHEIYAPGGSRDAEELIRTFLQRERSNEAFYRSLGIAPQRKR